MEAVDGRLANHNTYPKVGEARRGKRVTIPSYRTP
jgi:hypothetical protein